MPRPKALKGTGARTYVCERCGKEERLPHAGIGVEKACEHCGAACYCDPFPTPVFLERLAALSARLEAEDGPLEGQRV